jgi:DNA-binding MarR family transcriptional regulator
MPRLTPTDAASAVAHRIAQECLAMRIRRLGRAVTRIYDDALRPLGLSTAQHNILVAVAHAGPLRPYELSRALDLEKSTVTRNLDRMLARGWIRATPEPEGNGYRVELEAAGRALLERAMPSWSAAQNRARRQVGEALASALHALDAGGG